MLDKELIGGFKIEPRDYQLRITKTALDMFQGRFVGRNGLKNPAFKSVMVESPTGSGKTVIGFMTARLLQQQIEEATKTPVAVGWIAMRRTLLSQASRENISKGFDVPNIHFISMFDKRPEQLLRLK